MTKIKKSVVIGFGSIGQRHYRLLTSLGISTVVVSKRNIKSVKNYSTIEEAIEREQPEYIIIANETYLHDQTLKSIKNMNYNNKILVEKPLFSKYPEVIYPFSSLYVGYNLRFHPIVQKLQELLKEEKVLAVNTYVGQYLPTWRPNTDYTRCYSADINKGGGVIRDLSHELDYLSYLFGKWTVMTAIGGKISELSIQSDDFYSLLFETSQAVNVSVELNYLDKIMQRHMIIHTNRHTYKADFIQQTLQVDNDLIQFKVHSDDTYLSQHLAVINNKLDNLCNLQDGLEIVQMIEMAERCSKEKVWLKNE
ncbi:MAG: Gfo/Idh/MocA family oxidoreductase [Psychrobacillus sp.]